MKCPKCGKEAIEHPDQSVSKLELGDTGQAGRTGYSAGRNLMGGHPLLALGGLLFGMSNIVKMEEKRKILEKKTKYGCSHCGRIFRA